MKNYNGRNRQEREDFFKNGKSGDSIFVIEIDTGSIVDKVRRKGKFWVEHPAGLNSERAVSTKRYTLK